MGVQALRHVTANQTNAEVDMGSVRESVEEQPKAQSIRSVLQWLTLAFTTQGLALNKLSDPHSREGVLQGKFLPTLRNSGRGEAHQTTHNEPDLIAKTHPLENWQKSPEQTPNKQTKTKNKCNRKQQIKTQ